MEIRKLNTLRGLAALIVMIAHYSNHANWLNMNLGKGAGQIGVMLFFMLSGFLMSYLYLQKEFNKINLLNYIVARIARVMPLFLMVVFASFFLQETISDFMVYEIDSSNKLLAHLLLLQGVSVLWTIGPEIQFYALFIFIWLSSKRYFSFLLFIASLTVIALIFLGFPTLEGEFIGTTTSFKIFRCLPYFFVGTIMGYIYDRLTIPKYLRSHWLILILLFIPLLYPRIYFALTGIDHGLWEHLGVLFVISFVFFTVVFLIPNDNIFLANKLGDFVGKISYSLYLLHMPVLFLILKLEITNKEVTFLIFIGTSFVISYLSYKLIEIPSSKLLRQLRR